MRVVVVTGASAGVGRATARAFAARGDRVALLARGEARLRTAAEETGGLAIPADIAEHGEVEAAAARVEDELGPIDVWVNSAMATIFARFVDVEPSEYERATRVTYLGTVWGTMAALRRMLPRDRGTIVQVGSALAYRGIPLQAPYCGSKHAIKGLVDSLRVELRHERSNVHVTMVQLPAHNTPQFSWGRSRMPRHPQPVPPIFQPEVAAQAIVWASEHPRRELWVGASTAKAIVGNRVAPGLLDRYLARTGYDAQQTDEPVPRDRPDNLLDALPGDRGAHGRFASEARDRSVQLWVTTHRRALLAAGAAAGAAVSRRRRRRRRSP